MGYFSFYRFFDPLYLAVVVISLLLMIITQILVKSNYSKFSKINNLRGLTGAQAAKEILKFHGVYNVNVEAVSGKLTDHFDPRTNTIRLSEGVFASTSIAAIGVAAHEAGHAVQYAKNYAPIKVRTAIIPLANYGPTVGIILMLIGSFINAFNIIVIGLLLFAATFVFQLVTLPVEFNASRRALKTIDEMHLLETTELKGASKVLTAAALTYVAAMIQSLLTLLYYAVRLLGNNRRR